MRVFFRADVRIVASHTHLCFGAVLCCALVTQEYHDILGKKRYATSFLLPSGVARSIEGLVRLCKNQDNILVFCGAKGYTDLSEFEGRVVYPMYVQGSFTFIVNMDAIVHRSCREGCWT